jgi:hypothetical protein
VKAYKKIKGVLPRAWYKPATPIAVMIHAAGKYAHYGASRPDRWIISIQQNLAFSLVPIFCPKMQMLFKLFP